MLLEKIISSSITLSRKGYSVNLIETEILQRQRCDLECEHGISSRRTEMELQIAQTVKVDFLDRRLASSIDHHIVHVAARGKVNRFAYWHRKVNCGCERLLSYQDGTLQQISP